MKPRGFAVRRDLAAECGRKSKRGPSNGTIVLGALAVLSRLVEENKLTADAALGRLNELAGQRKT